jgi:DNA-binding SARP family transcriptional activator
MANFALRLLGSVEMRDADGRELHSLPSQPKRFGLLSYLAVAQPRGFHSRDKLMGLFWPEATREQARHALNQALHVLRTELGEDVVRSRGDSDVAIDEAAISCDAVEFERAVEDGEFGQALELYRGDLMEGLFVREAPEFERWLENERTRLREKAAGAAWALAHEHVKADCLVDAERTAQRALLLVPTDEGEVRKFIKALADAGDRAAAVRFYEKFAQRLRSEYEIEPDPLTATVAAKLTTASGETVAATPARLVSPAGGVTPADTPSSGVAFLHTWNVLIGVAVAASVIVALGTALRLSGSRGGRLDPNRVLVVELTDNSGREDAAVLGMMAQDYIIQVLTDAGFAEVVDPVTARAVSRNVAEAGMAGSAGEILALADEARAGTVVSGSYYAEGDSVYVQTRITGAGRSLETVGPVVGCLDSRTELVARLADAVVATLATVLNEKIGSWEPREPPATYQAFEAYSEGLEVYFTQGNYAEAARSFERAAVADPGFHRAAVWAVQSYFLAAWLGGGWPVMLKAESLLVPLQQSRVSLSPYERCHLEFVIALGRGINIRGNYEAARCMTQAAPGSDNAKMEFALALMRLNHPAEATKLLRELDPNRGRTKNYGGNWDVLSLAYHMLGDHKRELEVARQGRQRFPASPAMLAYEAYALAALGRMDDVAAVLEDMRSLPSQDIEWQLVQIADELRVHGHRDEARELFDEVIARFQSRSDQTKEVRANLAWALYDAERWDDAQLLFEKLAEEDPDNTRYLSWFGVFNSYPGWLGLLAARRGDRAEAERISEELRSTGGLFNKDNTSLRARIAALLGKRDEAVRLLQQNFDMVPPVDRYVLVHRSIDFESLQDYAEFQEFMRPKG